MKGHCEGKMNAVEKQCVVHVCSRPAIVGTSQSGTFLIRISFLTSKALSSTNPFLRLFTGVETKPEGRWPKRGPPKSMHSGLEEHRSETLQPLRSVPRKAHHKRTPTPDRQHL